MSNARFGLLVYVSVLLGCAVIGVVVAVGGNLLDHFQLIESVSTTLVCGGGIYAGVALLIRRELVAFAGLVVALEVVAFAVALRSIWGEHLTTSAGRWSATFLTLAIAALVVAAQRTTIDGRDRIARAGFLGTALCWAIASGFVINLIWDFPDDWSRGDVKVATSFYVLGAFGFLVTPALQRFRAAAEGPAGAGPSTTV
jgi:hypothetical protein